MNLKLEREQMIAETADSIVTCSLRLSRVSEFQDGRPSSANPVLPRVKYKS
jgi:hypothetical protein